MAIIDWERIATDYRVGIKSIREIAVENNISHTAIQKRAKANGWERDLYQKVKAQAEALVAKAAVAKKVATQYTATEKEVVEANAQMQADVILSHRKDIGRYRALAARLMDEMHATTDNTELFGQLSELMCDTAEGDAQDANRKRKELFDKVISTGGRVDAFKKLTETLKILVSIEREAFGVDDKREPASTGNINISF